MDSEAVRYQFDTVEIQPAAFTVLRDGQAVDLEPKAVRVLLYLIEHRDRAVTKDELFENVWGAAVTDNALTRIVAQLRRELGDDTHQVRYIQTLPTVGYRFIADLKVVQVADSPPRVAAARRPRRQWLIPAAALGALLVAVSVWQVIQRGTWGKPGGVRSTQLTTSPGLDMGARFSPDGSQMVYCSDRSGSFEIYRRPVASGVGEIQITSDGKQNIHPAWSPDGKWIAYHSVAQHGIWLVPAIGGASRRLIEFGSGPAWSPDGRQIAFRSSDAISSPFPDFGGLAESTIWALAADGTQLRQLTTPGNPPGGHAMPSWSTDGKHLAFSALSNDSSIWSLELASAKLEMLVKAGRDVPRQPRLWAARLADPTYSPTTKGLYFSAVNERGENAIYFLPRPGERPVELKTTDRETPSGIAISPDGKRLAFTRLVNISRLEMVTPNADPKALFEDAVKRVSLPSFSPDGEHLAFSVETAGRNRDLWVMKADGTGGVPVSSDPGQKE